MAPIFLGPGEYFLGQVVGASRDFFIHKKRFLDASFFLPKPNKVGFKKWQNIKTLCTFCKYASQFDKCPDFLQIEIYYYKKGKISGCIFLGASFLQRKRALVKYFLSRSELSLAFTSEKLSRELLPNHFEQLCPSRILSSWSFHKINFSQLFRFSKKLFPISFISLCFSSFGKRAHPHHLKFRLFYFSWAKLLVQHKLSCHEKKSYCSMVCAI